MDNSVVLTSYNGRLFSCNPKYLSIGLLNTGKFNVYFAIKKGRNVSLPDGIKRVDYRSLKHIYLLMVSKYIVVNSTGFTGLLPYRKRQVLINTWHGAGLFKTSGVEFFKKQEDLEKRKLFGDNTTYFLSSSEKYTDKQIASMLVPKERFLTCGLPRNDLFFEDHPEIIRRVKQHFEIPELTKIVLYAPTYRDGAVNSLKNYGFKILDISRVIQACKQRFDCDFTFLFKAHHDMIPENIDNNCINASNYTDTQELLYAADVLITDYSSLQWDFALQRKPGFLYSPDIEQYMSVHPFASDYHDWPFETALNNDELVRMIEQYDEDAGHRRIENYFKKLGNYEDGSAVKQILKMVFGVQV